MRFDTDELRKRYANRYGGHKLALDAADEIERLRAALKAILDDPEAGLNIIAYARAALDDEQQVPAGELDSRLVSQI